MSSKPSHLRYHLIWTVRPCSGLDRNLPSIAVAVAVGSSSISKTCEAIHSQRCPNVIGRCMIAAIFRVDGFPFTEELCEALHGLVVHVRQCRMRISSTQLGLCFC